MDWPDSTTESDVIGVVLGTERAQNDIDPSLAFAVVMKRRKEDCVGIVAVEDEALDECETASTRGARLQLHGALRIEREGVRHPSRLPQVAGVVQRAERQICTVSPSV